MKQEVITAFNGTHPSKNTVDLLCGRLLDIPWYNSEDMDNVNILLRWMRQRKVKHSIEYDEKNHQYISIVKVKLPNPVKLTATADGDYPAIALSLCGAQLARLANI